MRTATFDNPILKLVRNSALMIDDVLSDGKDIIFCIADVQKSEPLPISIRTSWRSGS